MIDWKDIQIYPMGTPAIFWIDTGLQAYVVNGYITEDDRETIWSDYDIGYSAEHVTHWSEFNPPEKDFNKPYSAQSIYIPPNSVIRKKPVEIGQTLVVSQHFPDGSIVLTELDEGKKG